MTEPLIDVRFGDKSLPKDWPEDDTQDDDEELDETPQDVIELLGFDPKDLES